MILHSAPVSLVRPLVLCAVAAFAATGCAVDTEQGGSDVPEVEHVGATSSAFTITGGASWAGDGSLQGPLGYTNAETCFLTQVAGNLTSYSGQPGSGNEARIEVAASGSGRDIFTVQAGSTGGFVGGAASCIATSGRSRTGSVYFGSGAEYIGDGIQKPLGTAVTNRRCFINSVINQALFNHAQPFTSAGDLIKVFVSDGEWYIGGSGSVSGYATCVNVTQVLASATILQTPTLVHGFLLTNQPGLQCYLTAIGGAFNTQDGSGVKVSLVGQYWFLDVAVGKSAVVECSI